MSPELSRRQLLAGGAVGLGLAGAGLGGAVTAGWRPASGVPAAPVQASGGNGMNALILVMDETRTDHVGAYGSSVRTPNIDAFAASGTRFTRAYPESMPTVPVRRAVHTGMRGFPFRGWRPYQGLPGDPGWAPIPQDHTTLATMLEQCGYTRVLLADNPMYFRPSMDLQRGFTSFQWIRGQGFDPHGLPDAVPPEVADRYLAPAQRDPGWSWYDSLRKYLSEALHWKTEDEWPGARVCAAAADMLRSLRDMQPFLLVVDTFEPHGPFFPPPRYTSMYGERRGAVEPILPSYGPADYLTADEIERTDQLYSGEITFTDRWLGRVFDTLDATGLADSTLVILLSDHGVLLGDALDHGLIGKPGDTLLRGLTDLVYVARHPEKGHGTTSETLVSTHDVAPTVLAGLDVVVDSPLDGGDVFDTSSAAGRRTCATSIYSRTLWARDATYTLVAPEYGAKKRLFDWRRDPDLRDDLADRKPGVVERLWGKIVDDAGGRIPQYA